MENAILFDCAPKYIKKKIVKIIKDLKSCKSFKAQLLNVLSHFYRNWYLY